MPDLDFHIESAAPHEYAAAPTLLFTLRIVNHAPEPVRSVTLATQIRIAANRRPYTPEERERLWEVFGPIPLWGEGPRSLLWAHATTLVPAFTGSTVVEVAVPCTYDFEVTTAKYFHVLDGGGIPLEFLFSGTMFYAGPAGLQAALIPWEKEARYRLPVDVWKRMMDQHFPHSAWLRLPRDVFDRLYRYKVRQGAPTWEDALVRLLRDAGEEAG